MYFFIAVLIILISMALIYFFSNSNNKGKHNTTNSANINKKKDVSSSQSRINKKEDIPGNVLTEKEMNEYINTKVPVDLIKYTIPYNFTILDNKALRKCTSLTELNIHDKLFLLEEQSFIYCTNLININVHEDNKNYCSKLGVLFSKDSKEIISYPAAKHSSTYFIPQGVEKINSHAFTNNKYLKYVIIPNTVTRIEENAFVNCKLLKQIVIPENVSYIHPRAFNMCPRLSLRGYEDSLADNYSKDYYIPFEYLSK